MFALLLLPTPCFLSFASVSFLYILVARFHFCFLSLYYLLFFIITISSFLPRVFPTSFLFFALSVLFHRDLLFFFISFCRVIYCFACFSYLLLYFILYLFFSFPSPLYLSSRSFLIAFSLLPIYHCFSFSFFSHCIPHLFSIFMMLLFTFLSFSLLSSLLDFSLSLLLSYLLTSVLAVSHAYSTSSLVSPFFYLLSFFRFFSFSITGSLSYFLLIFLSLLCARSWRAIVIVVLFLFIISPASSFLFVLSCCVFFPFVSPITCIISMLCSFCSVFMPFPVPFISLLSFFSFCYSCLLFNILFVHCPVLLFFISASLLSLFLHPGYLLHNFFLLLIGYCLVSFFSVFRCYLFATFLSLFSILFSVGLVIFCPLASPLSNSIFYFISFLLSLSTPLLLLTVVSLIFPFCFLSSFFFLSILFVFATHCFFSLVFTSIWRFCLFIYHF